MIGWITHLQHTRAKDVFFVGILDEKLDDFNRKVYVPQIDGAKTGLELPGIVDEVLTIRRSRRPEARRPSFTASLSARRSTPGAIPPRIALVVST